MFPTGFTFFPLNHHDILFVWIFLCPTLHLAALISQIQEVFVGIAGPVLANGRLKSIRT